MCFQIHKIFAWGDINKFILLLRKSVYPYEYMDSFERFFETSLLDKDVFYSNLNMESITDIDYRHANNVFNKFNNNNNNLVIIMICIFKAIHFCLQMFLPILEKFVLLYMN